MKGAAHSTTVRKDAALCALAALALASAACLAPQDDPTSVKDLRVLAVSFERPEIFAPACDATALAVLAQEVTYTALIVDPAGGGRPLRYELWACADPNDRLCEKREERVDVARGETVAGELSLTVRPGTLLLEDGTPLLQQVIEKDPYQGLGGGRMPFVLHLYAGDDEIYAQKLMVFGCAFFPEMKANVTPVLPGVRLGEAVLEEGVPLEVTGGEELPLEPLDFAALQESYIVPSFELQPVHLEERWRLAYFTDVGKFSRGETGGTNLAGEDARHQTAWRPPAAAEGTEPKLVNVWIVVRDGRGGVSWLHRTLRWTPPQEGTQDG